MNYSLVSIGDSLTQGFRSFAICKDFQEFSFPYLIYLNNSNKIESFNLPPIDPPGFPINLENLLYRLEEFDIVDVDIKEVEKLFAKVMHRRSSFKKSTHHYHNNLGIYGFTAKQVYGASFNNTADPLEKHIVPIEDLPVLNRIFNLTNLINDGIRSLFSKHFVAFNFSRTVYEVLCASHRGNRNFTQIDTCLRISKLAEENNEKCLVTYFAGSNDIIGALMSGEEKYISKTSDIIGYIEKALNKILEAPNTLVAIADIPGIDHIPFIDKNSLKPIFPMYSKASQRVLDRISRSIEDVNNGIYKLLNNLDDSLKSRVSLVKINSFFENISKSGPQVRLKSGAIIKLTTDYISLDESGKISKGGVFSLDGVHPTATGYALLANEFIKAFNTLGVPLKKINVDLISREDPLLNKPPKLISEFLDVNSSISVAAQKLGLYGYIQAVMLSQFNLNNKV